MSEEPLKENDLELGDVDEAPLREAPSQSIRADQFGAPRLFPAPKLMDLYRTPSKST